MTQNDAELPHDIRQQLDTLGQRIRTARVRRRWSTEELAQACGVGRRTLYRVENGDPGVALGTWLGVLWKLGLLHTLDGVAHPDSDEHGKILEAAARPQRVRAAAENLDF